MSNKLGPRQRAFNAVPKPPKNNELFVCIESHVSDRGAFLEGNTARANHPDVQALPACWVPESFTTEERLAAHLTRFPRVAE